MHRILFTVITIVLLTGDAYAQTAIVKGSLINQATKQPANDVQLSLPRIKRLTTSNGEGSYTFSEVPYGEYTLIVGGQNYRADTIKISVASPVVDLPVMEVSPNERANLISQELPTIALDENNLSSDDDGVKAQNVSGLLTASRDPFLNTASFTFGPMRFQARGYDRNGQQVLVNGAPVNDIETGDAYWSQWGGLNDVFRSRANTYGLQPSEYTFGGVNGSTYFDATAANQRKQTKVSYSLGNRSYRDRLMLTHSSGLQKNGWAYSVSLTKRWAQEGYVEGTFYDSYSFYGAVSKRIGTKHEINLTAFGSPTRRGKSAPATQEAYDLAGSNFYNPNWGYQNGVKRNAKVANNFQPIVILNYEYKPNNKLRWNTAVAYQWGKNSNSTLDWYNARDPRPDYYRNLPSYLIASGDDPSTALFNTEKQINWDRLYNVNYANVETIHNANGITGNDVTGKRSVYAEAADVDAVNKFIFNSNVERVLSEHWTLAGGLGVVSQKTESYRELLDLMGGDFFLNLNQFAVQQNVPNVNFNQYDLDNPNRLIHVGDKYNYDYITRFTKGNLWAQGTATYNKLDLFVAIQGGTYAFTREGLYRNGLFPNSSLGKGDAMTFGTYSAKGGATYKINGRHYLFINGMTGSEAPTVDNTYISSRTRSFTVADPVPEHIGSLEAGYLMRSPKYNIRAVGYVTDIKDATDIKRFYNDDPAYQTFVNYVMTSVNKRNIGLELAVEAKVTTALTITGVASIGQAFYTDNPNVSIYRDNDTVTTANAREVFIKNFYVAAGPQSAYSLGFNYRSKQYWYATLNLNYFDRNYVDVNPDRRTAEAVDLLTPGTQLYDQITGQEKLPGAFTVDISAGKSFLLSKYNKQIPRNTFLNIYAGISNLLDNRNIKTGGFEQLRYDFTDNNPSKFPTKYFYGLGRNFSINISLRF